MVNVKLKGLSEEPLGPTSAHLNSEEVCWVLSQGIEYDTSGNNIADLEKGSTVAWSNGYRSLDNGYRSWKDITNRSGTRLYYS